MQYNKHNKGNQVSVVFKVTDMFNIKTKEMNSLHYAARKGKLEMVRTLILEGADVNAKKRDGETPLHYGVRYNHADVVKLLISAGAEVNSNLDDGFTVLHTSANIGYTNIVKILISAGADVNAKEEDGRTPLHYGALEDHTDIVKTLISASAVVDAKDDYGETPLILSASKGHAEILKVLISAGADVNAKDTDGWTCLHWCAYHGYRDILKALISAGADVNAKAKNGRTPLHRSVLSGHEDIVKILISAGAHVDARNKLGYTPLLYTSWNGHENVNIIKTLISAGADASALNNDRRNFFDDLDPTNPLNKVVIKYSLLYNYKLSLKEVVKHRNDLLDGIWNECEKQVENMKETLLGVSRTSVYELITEVCENKLALYMSEQNFGLKTDSKRSSYIEMFPMYAEDIEEQFNKGSERANLLHKSRELMMICFCQKLPPELIRTICEYMPNTDMQTFLNVNNIF